MYLLEYLKEAETMAGRDYDFKIEYRLVCSGEFDNRTHGGEAWGSFESARLLLERPFELFVVSRPFNRFPQELCLRFGLNEGGDDIDLVEDICAVLTLLSRRLVVPGFKTHVVDNCKGGTTHTHSFTHDHPQPIVELGDVSLWGIRYLRAEKSRLVEHTPPALGVDSGALERAFGSLSQHEHKKQLLQAARAYSSALQMIWSRPELAYQLLISAVETFSAGVFADFQPDREDMMVRRSGLVKKAISFGCSAHEADKLGFESLAGEYWVGRKFRMFLEEYSSKDCWGPDRVFPLAEGWEPDHNDLKKALGAIYSSRSKYLHEGKELPWWVNQPPIAVPATFHELPKAAEYVPPVMWFERLVGTSLNHWLQKQAGGERAFLEN